MVNSPHHSNQVQADRLREVFRELVDRYSPSGKEHEVVEYVAELLEANGFPVELREVADGRCNVEVVPDPKRLQVALLGHLDTVPAFDIENYAFQEAENRIFGLGTADMKGGCAALIEACLAIGPDVFMRGNTGLFLVVGEEETGDGTSAFLESYPDIPSALVAEPTDLRVCTAHYGYIEMHLRAFGTRRHASMAGRDHNAIHALLKALLQLGEYVEENCPDTVFNIRDLHSSEAGFAVPDRCGGWVDVHIPPQQDPRIVANELQRVADHVLAAARPSRHELAFPTLARGFRTADDNPFACALQAACQAAGVSGQADVFRSHSDANLLHDAGSNPIIFGPGQLARAHTRDESIDFGQVVKAADVYRHLLLNPVA